MKGKSKLQHSRFKHKSTVPKIQMLPLLSQFYLNAAASLHQGRSTSEWASGANHSQSALSSQM